MADIPPQTQPVIVWSRLRQHERYSGAFIIKTQVCYHNGVIRAANSCTLFIICYHKVQLFRAGIQTVEHSRKGPGNQHRCVLLSGWTFNKTELTITDGGKRSVYVVCYHFTSTTSVILGAYNVTWHGGLQLRGGGVGVGCRGAGLCTTVSVSRGNQGNLLQRRKTRSPQTLKTNHRNTHPGAKGVVLAWDPPPPHTPP